MNKLALLNTTIITSNGSYSLFDISLKDARELAQGHGLHDNVLSAIGHESTAQILTELLGIPVEMNRINFKQEAGQTALCFKLNGRPVEGKILSREEIESMGYEFKVMHRII